MSLNHSGRRNLVRPRDGKIIAGVCAGLARRFGTTTTTMRVIFIASCILPGTQVLVYIALWIIMPKEGG
ncbi:phage shock protein C (PspC) family protein [Haloactinopolyspora alba]|uniref:Phage shock protein C (PspC) family protein n=1 Tax=Haloactinopolyspora alba TaxID=648780 RepID=A0A2P8E149_9ACTN|nr:PspC domain-containing protein [Haloactinopolyspora alba]PSL03204.1 phage shock protein C (PspC) family protein [Haloactinopolyspora alba]